MCTHLLNFVIVTKRISDWHHIASERILQSFLQVTVSVGTMELTLSLAIMQVLKFHCKYAGGISVTLMLMNLFVAIKELTVSVAIIQLEVSATLMQVTVSAANMHMTIFIIIMQMGVSGAVMQVVYSAVH